MRAKKLSLYALLVALGLAFTYFETFIPLNLLLPGLKLGLANSVVLLLLGFGDIKGALCVNIVRICVSSLLFGTPMSFVFSLLGGVLSTVCMALTGKIREVSSFGVGVVGGAAHNVGQMIAACIVFKSFSVLLLLPWLTLLGAVCGALTGFITLLLLRNKHINTLFNR